MKTKLKANDMINLANAPEMASSRAKLGFTGPITAADLDTTAAAIGTPNANEFISDMVNLIARSEAFSVWSFNLPYGRFELSQNPYGDGEIFTVSDLASSYDFGLSGDPDDSSFIPKVAQTEIKTVEKKVIRRSISEDILKGANLSAGESFSSLMNILIEGIQNAYINDIWEIIGAEIVAGDKSGKAPVPLLASSVLTGYDATKPEDKILAIKNVMSKMKYPGKEWVIGGAINNATPISEQVIVMNDTTDNEIGVKGYSYMYNQDKAQFAAPIFDIQIPDNMVLIGNPKAYIWDIRILKTTSRYNDLTTTRNYFLHYWIRHGFIDGVQFVALDLS